MARTITTITITMNNIISTMPIPSPTGLKGKSEKNLKK